MATPFPFQAAATLLASQLNAITTLVTSTKTASHTLTIADVGTRVIMNSASATTITVNTSIFGASDVVEILNIGAGVCTVTAGTCTVGTSGTLALVQNAGGTLTFISASASVFRATAVGGSSGLTLIKSQAIVAGATTFTMSSAFSATYENYLLTAANLVISGAGDQMRVTINGSAGSTYQSSFININFSSSTITGTVASLVSTGVSMGDQTAASTQISANFYSPFLAKASAINGQQSNTTGSRIFSGVDSNAASSTAFTITMATNTFTSGTFYLYGYSIT